MELLYAALLLHKAGKPVDETHLKKVLESAGIHADEGKIKALISALADIDIEKVIKEASSMPVASAAPQAAKKEVKEEKKDEKKEEDAAIGLSSLFG